MSAPVAVPAFYFDGRTSRRFAVELLAREGMASISGEAERHCPLDELRVSERMRHAARKVTFPDGAYLEIQDNAAFSRLLLETGHQDSLVVRMQQSWRATLLACAGVAAILVLGYLYGLPAAANLIAKLLPQRVERMIGSETLRFLDANLLAPSKLPPARQEAIIARFRNLTPPRAGAPAPEILFRKSRIGPNALALPSGQIILTDDIVELMKDDDAVMGILGHELGHLHERHLLRRVIQGSVIAATGTLLFGDVSAVVANIPTLMLDLKYSRDAEREADDYAIAMLKANGIGVNALVTVFEKLERQAGGTPPYLSSHPPGPERIERIRAAR